MTGHHIANQSKLIFSEYGWPETLVSDNGPCYTAEVFTNLMKEYNANHITSSPHYPLSNGLAKKYVQLVKNLFYKAKEEEKHLFKCLMVYCNTPLSNNLQSPMQILASISARSDLPISNAAKKQLGFDCENLRTKYKNEHLPLHHLHLNQAVMYQDSPSKYWFPATITKLCQEARSYIITTKEGVQYRKTQAHLKPPWLQDKKVEGEHVLQNNHMCTAKHCILVKRLTMQHNVDQRRTLSPQLNWIYKEHCDYLVITLYITCFLPFILKWLPNRGQIADTLTIYIYIYIVD